MLDAESALTACEALTANRALVALATLLTVKGKELPSPFTYVVVASTIEAVTNREPVSADPPPPPFSA